MDLQADIKWIIKELQDVKDPKFIEVIVELLKSRKKTAQHPERISIEQYNKEIDEAEKEIESGNFYTMEEVRKVASKWGRK